MGKTIAHGITGWSVVTAKGEGTMRRYSTALLLAGAIVVSHASTASAQRWGREAVPRSGVCFYEDIDFGGRYFCSPIGAAVDIPRAMNDAISSIKIIGDGAVTIFGDDGLRGQSRVIDSDVRDLRDLGFNDRISSYRVDLARSVANDRYRDGGDRYRQDGYRDDRYRDDRYRDDRYRDDRDRDDRYRDDRGNGRLSYRDAEGMVRRSYRAVLQREPDPDGLRNWAEQVQQHNWTQRDLENALRQSDEYRALREGRRR